jgi:hypothetical protein
MHVRTRGATDVLFAIALTIVAIGLAAASLHLW